MSDQPPAQHGEHVERKRVALAGRLDLSEIPRPRIFLSWYDERTCLVVLSIGTRFGDAVCGLDIEVTDPPGWLARAVDREWYKGSDGSGLPSQGSAAGSAGSVSATGPGPSGISHKRESTNGHGPDYCGPCSEAISDWVPWEGHLSNAETTGHSGRAT